MSRLEHQVVFMLSSSLWDREKLAVQESLDRLWDETPIHQELVELLALLDEQASHLPLTLDDDLPLRVHARYSLAEIMAGMGISTPDRQERPQAGVRWDEASKKASANAFRNTTWMLATVTGASPPSPSQRPSANSCWYSPLSI